MHLFNEIKLLYNELKSKLELLEEEYKKLKEIIPNLKLEYEIADKNLKIQEDLLRSLEKEKDGFLQKAQTKFGDKFFILSESIVFFTAAFLTFVWLGLPLNPFRWVEYFNNSFTDSDFSIMLCKIGIYGAVYSYFNEHKFDKKIFSAFNKKILPVLMERKTNKIINSKEYQDLLENVKKQEKQVELAKTDVTEKEESFASINTKYNKIKQEEAEQKILLNYFDKQMNPTETTLHISRGLKPEHKDYINNIDNKC